ncbi:hypothetical protein T484DRAFT_1764071 [Baffinella frigidus]|nr:hypothetical protein T484DRAFT_1764071 [Cryptophyta sp. CCMP2293]
MWSDRDEECDDEGTTPLDGCSANCSVEAGAFCTGAPSTCCLPCPAGKYRSGCDVDGDGLIQATGECVDCEGTTFKEEVASFDTECAALETCPLGNYRAGYNRSYGGGCIACEAGTYQNASGVARSVTACSACPYGATSDAGATALSQCRCLPGWRTDAAAPLACSRIPPCDVLGVNDCHRNATCVAGLGTAYGCECSEGYSGDGFVCLPTCGDGRKMEGEACDDGNSASGDGCSSLCTVEGNSACSGGNATTPDACACTPDFYSPGGIIPWCSRFCDGSTCGANGRCHATKGTCVCDRFYLGLTCGTSLTPVSTITVLLNSTSAYTLALGATGESLVFPAGSVPDGTTINVDRYNYASLPADSKPSTAGGVELGDQVLDLRPEGITFSPAVTLTMATTSLEEASTRSDPSLMTFNTLSGAWESVSSQLAEGLVRADL